MTLNIAPKLPASSVAACRVESSTASQCRYGKAGLVNIIVLVGGIADVFRDLIVIALISRRVFLWKKRLVIPSNLLSTATFFCGKEDPIARGVQARSGTSDAYPKARAHPVTSYSSLSSSYLQILANILFRKSSCQCSRVLYRSRS